MKYYQDNKDKSTWLRRQLYIELRMQMDDHFYDRWETPLCNQVRMQLYNELRRHLYTKIYHGISQKIYEIFTR